MGFRYHSMTFSNAKKDIQQYIGQCIFDNVWDTVYITVSVEISELILRHLAFDVNVEVSDRILRKINEEKSFPET
jgi:hypothetical protein